MSGGGPATGLVTGLGTAAGRGLGAAFGTVGRLRGGRALHPQGVALTGTLTRSPGAVRSGIAWLDAAGTDPVRGRLSRSAGLPTLLPDVLGLALRCPTPDGPVDLLLTATGLGRWTRWLLAPHRRVDGVAATGTPQAPPS